MVCKNLQLFNFYFVLSGLIHNSKSFLYVIYIYHLFCASNLSASQDCFCHLDHTLVFFNIVDTDKRASLHYANYTGSLSPLHALIYRKIQCQSDHGFAGCTKENRKSQILKKLQVIHCFQIHFKCFSKTNSRISAWRGLWLPV